MVKHIVCIKFKPGIAESEIAELTKSLGALPPKIPEIRSFEFGPDILRTERSFDFALVASYEDVEALKRYQVHPDHLPVLAKVRNSPKRSWLWISRSRGPLKWATEIRRL